MRIADDPRSVVIRFPPEADRPPELEVGLAVTIAQLAWLAWEIDNVAREARQGQVMALAAQQREAQAIAARIRNGGH